jgi:hypothetical protein
MVVYILVIMLVRVDELGFDSLDLILNLSFSDKKCFVDVKYG